MSRGLGKRQRRILDALTEVSELHGNVFVLLRSLARQDSSLKVDTSEMESTRRAVRRLEELDYVETRVLSEGSRKVVRLRTEGQRPDLPSEIDHILWMKLEHDDAWHNDRLRRYGSRWRRMHVSRPYREYARVFDLERRAYYGVYLAPAESRTADDDRLDHNAREKLIEELDLKSREKVEQEIQRRVDEELERRGYVQKSCTCSQDRPALAVSADRAPEVLIELLTNLGEAFGDSFRRDSLINRRTSVEQDKTN